MASSPRHTRKGSGGTKSLGEIMHTHGLGHGQSLGVPGPGTYDGGRARSPARAPARA